MRGPNAFELKHDWRWPGRLALASAFGVALALIVVTGPPPSCTSSSEGATLPMMLGWLPRGGTILCFHGVRAQEQRDGGRHPRNRAHFCARGSRWPPRSAPSLPLRDLIARSAGGAIDRRTRRTHFRRRLPVGGTPRRTGDQAGRRARHIFAVRSSSESGGAVLVGPALAHHPASHSGGVGTVVCGPRDAASRERGRSRSRGSGCRHRAARGLLRPPPTHCWPPSRHVIDSTSATTVVEPGRVSGARLRRPFEIGVHTVTPPGASVPLR
jgi:hypothetical protein